MMESPLILAYSTLIPECAVSHVTSVLAILVSCIVLGILEDNYDMRASFFVFNLMALCHLKFTLISTDINITETTYSCQF